MKITIERLREIITEEVSKEELAPEIAAPAIAAMLQGMQAETTSDVFGAAFDELYGEGALEGEAERQAGMEEPEEEEFPTDYQAGGAYGDRPQIGFKEGIEEIIKEEVEFVLSEIRRFDPTQELGAQGLSRDDTLYYEPEDEGVPEQQIAAVRSQVGDMSYEIEKMLVALLKAGYSPEDIINMAAQIKQMDLHPEDVQVAETKEKDNPWRICTESVGREDKEKYEKCVKSVKKEKGIE
jgi:hypothetical protein